MKTVEVQTQSAKGKRWGVQAIYLSEESAADEVARWKARGINVRTVTKEKKEKPGAWRVEQWSGGEGYLAGFYVVRANNGRTEWMQAPRGKRALRFATEEAAREAIEQANAKP